MNPLPVKLRPAPGQQWDRSCHRWPCDETDRLDRFLNEIEERTIHLSPAERERAHLCGRVRRRSSRGLRDRQVSEEAPEFIDILGVMGEMGACRYLRLRYEFTVNTFRAADLPHQIEVRTTQWPSGHCKVRPDDDDERRIIMAVVPTLDSPVLLAGWVTAAQGKLFPLRDPHGAAMPFHFVPQDSLRPMPELRQLIPRP